MAFEQNPDENEIREEELETAADDHTETAEATTEETIEECVEDSIPEAAEEPDKKKEGKPDKKGESIFSKKKKDAKQQKIDELTDRLQRNMAEFDNFRKRTEKEKAGMYIVGAKDIVEKILPVVDNFERGLAAAGESNSFTEGMELVYRQLVTTLEELGVKKIEATGQAFDPNLHNAVMHVEDESVGENIVVEELQTGYTYKDFVVRHSMVKVAN
ncbi:MAG: nucleotide exchange factor GrpE [Lachnospiraceae bacterium]